jgi:ubiquinone/menaquinone biosynthesis C-methylase UbiE
MQYIRRAIEETNAKRILELGAGTGRYCVELAKDGFEVTALELMQHYCDTIKSKLDGSEKIEVIKGDALDLSMFKDEHFDLTLSLGPMYHLFEWNDKIKALSEAVRVTKRGGYILVAYCMNEPTVIQYIFGQNKLFEEIDSDRFTKDWHVINLPRDIFSLVRIEDIAELDKCVDVERAKLVALDGLTKYIRNEVEAMDDQVFNQLVKYHLAVCERQDLIGASNHVLDIVKRA